MANKAHGPDGKFVAPFRQKGRAFTQRRLSQLVRAIGEEQIDEELKMSRLEALVRTLYADAIAGKTDAAKVLLERGWGKVPTPVKIDLRSEIEALLDEAGLTVDEAAADPILRGVLENRVIEGQAVRVGQLSGKH